MKDKPTQADLESIRHLVNNQPIDDFEGLSSNEMHSLIYYTFGEDSPLKILKKVPDGILDQLPFFRLSEEFLKIIERETSIKLTSLGMLPKKVIEELYAFRIIPDEMIERGITKLSREIYWNALYQVHSNTYMAKLIRKVHGKYFLTKTGARLLKKENRSELFHHLLKTYTDVLDWSSLDGYPSVPVGNLGWGFTILLLQKFGNEVREKKLYAEKYMKAFPEMIQFFPESQFSTKEMNLIRCYSLRTFDRFLEWWGMVEVAESKPILDREQLLIKKAPILNEVFHFE